MGKRDYYTILGIAKNASDAEIKRRIARRHYHPDRNPGDSTVAEKFREAAEAYEVLSNPAAQAK